MSKILFAFIPFALASCGGPDDLAVTRAEQLMAVWESGDTVPLDSLLSDSVVYDDMPNGERYVGREESAAYVRHVHGWAGAVSVTIEKVHGDNRVAVAEWVMSGIQDAPIGGRVPVATNRSFTLHGATIVELDDVGHIKRAADYIDVLGFVVQLGARVELPGGTVIGGDK